MNTIIPTVGRKVWYYRNDEQVDPIDATVIKVTPPDGEQENTSLSRVNLAAIEPDTARSFLVTDAVVGEDGDSHSHYRWMPYQQAQAQQAKPEGKKPQTKLLDAGSSDKAADAEGAKSIPSQHQYPRFGPASAG